MSVSRRSLCVSPSAAQRLAFARAFLRMLPPREPALLLVPSNTAGTQLLASVLAPGEARFGVRKLTLEALARELALPELARERRVPLRGLAIEALVTRVVAELGAHARLGRYAPLADRPGFVRALARTIDELRLGEVAAERLAPHAPELAAVLAAYVEALAQLGLADRAHTYAAAQRALANGRAAALPPLLALDVALINESEASLAHALGGGRAPACATVIHGDERSELHWRSALGSDTQVVRRSPAEDTMLGRLQARLFSASMRPAPVPPAQPDDRPVQIVSSPGEGRECVEVARGILAAAADGVPFDRMTVLLRAGESYRAVLEEALARAEIPAHFADGVRRPLRAGRALLALLACARDGLSAQAFAEYLSLGALPEREGEAGLVTPRKWERMLVEAAVIGGRDRWARRLAGLARELMAERALLDEDDPRRADLQRDGEALARLEAYAGPLLDQLAGLPEGGTWGAWISALSELARAAVREPDAIIELLAELAPLAPVGPVSVASVYRVLAQRLSSVVIADAGHGAGKVFVGAIDDVRGRAFEAVFVLGLAERVFPARIEEDPLLADEIRRKLGATLWLTEERAQRERLLLRTAVGAADARLWLSYPRFDVAHGRPRVPSFYGLEVLQAIDGTLPAFDELTRRADPGAAARMGFPAPALPAQAIDDAEYDLARLAQLMRAPAELRRGAARYLLEANPHLARALRFRARRWELARFSPADGFVATTDEGRALLAPNRLAESKYSASALAHFTVCPYRFYLHAVVKLAEQPEVAATDELDLRQRGILFHRVQRALLSALRDAGGLPVTRASLPHARVLLARIFAAHADAARDDFAPSIEQVFETGLSAVQRDLGEWLERLADEPDFVPLHFELGFGLSRSGELAPESRDEPVQLPLGLRLAGAIDLVERARDATGASVLRATDHKTGNAIARLGTVNGGRVLQPLLYALALEQLFPGDRVASGRLYFCTERGEFKRLDVPLDESSRSVASELIASIDKHVADGFLPAAPATQPEDRARSECDSCAYRVVCGPYEGERLRVKGRDLTRLAPLSHVRNLP